MKTGNGDRVLYQIRAMPARSGAFQSSREGSKPRTIIFNGISANSWLLPIGLNKRDILQKKEKNTCVKSTETKATDCVHEDGKPQDTPEKNEGDESVCETTESKAEDTCTKAETQPMTAAEFDSLWERLPPRPKTTGTVYIIRNRQVPAGIGKDEFLQGQRLSTRSDPNGGNNQEGSSPLQRKPRPYTAPGRRFGNNRGERICLTPTWRPLSQRDFRTDANGMHGKKQDVDSSLDLVVTSLDLHKDNPPKSPYTVSSQAYSPRQDEALEGRMSSAKSRSVARAGAKSVHSRFNRESTDTIEGIKRSYSRRAQSAPPNGRNFAMGKHLDHHDPTSSSRGPTLYWRAKSSYHKRVMAFGPDEDDAEHSEETVSLRGSFWRPLMVPDDGDVPMQHSAGCPYKCKGCFKACLVSEDYLQKARAEKLLQQQEQKRTSHSAHRPALAQFRKKVRDARDIVNRALARSQPLYKMVHGDGEGSKTERNLGVDGEENGGEPVTAKDLADYKTVTPEQSGSRVIAGAQNNKSESVLKELNVRDGVADKVRDDETVRDDNLRTDHAAIGRKHAWVEETDSKDNTYC